MTEPGNPSTRAPAGRIPAWAMTVLRGGAISVGLGVIFAWLGVYQSGEIPFPERIVYWSALIALGSAAALLINPLVFDRWMAGSHPALQIAVVSCVISVPITIGLVAIEYVSVGRLAEPGWWWVQFGYVLVISALLTTGGWALDRLGEKSSAAVAPSGNPAAAPAAIPVVFADRLPARFRAGTIYAVSAEDHYLRVHTSAGETMILMRLADAIRELTALEGLQVHRSWWVARQGLADVSKGDGRVTLKLKSGVDAPVSRANLKVVREAGWL
jgi:LytTr DNA-binding domain